MPQLSDDTVIGIDFGGKIFLIIHYRLENQSMMEDLILESLQVALKDIWKSGS